MPHLSNSRIPQPYHYVPRACTLPSRRQLAGAAAPGWLARRAFRAVMLVSLWLLAGGCGPFRGYTGVKRSGFVPRQLPGVTLLAPIASMGTISRGNKVEYSVEASQQLEQLIGQATQKYGHALHVAASMPLDSLQRRVLARELSEASQQWDQQRSFIDRSLLPMMERVTADVKTRYVAALIGQGFTRTTQNADNQERKGLLIGVFSLGTVQYTPFRAITCVNLFVYDRQEKRIQYYNHGIEIAEPLEGSNTEAVVYYLLSKDFGLVAPTPTLIRLPTSPM